MAELERLNKVLAFQLGVSRREADDLIAAGRILVNDTTIKLGAKVDISDQIKFDGHLIKRNQTRQLIIFHKPVGYTCSRANQVGDQTVYDILPEKFRKLKLVGRLDKDSSGLILLTNDGDFAYRMTHPKFHQNKTYLVQLDRTLAPLHQQLVSDYGINLEDGRSQMLITKLTPEEVADLNIVYTFDDAPIYQVELGEGRNRQIRRTFAALGYEVTKLHRISLANYFIAELASRQWRSGEF